MNDFTFSGGRAVGENALGRRDVAGNHAKDGRNDGPRAGGGSRRGGELVLEDAAVVRLFVAGRDGNGRSLGAGPWRHELPGTGRASSAGSESGARQQDLRRPAQRHDRNGREGKCAFFLPRGF